MADASTSADLSELERLRNEVTEWKQRWYRDHSELHRVLCEGAFRLDRDPMDLQPVFAALQDGAISTGKARESVRRWLAGLPLELPDYGAPEPESAVAERDRARAWARAWKHAARKLGRMYRAAALLGPHGSRGRLVTDLYTLARNLAGPCRGPAHCTCTRAYKALCSACAQARAIERALSDAETAGRQRGLSEALEVCETFGAYAQELQRDAPDMPGRNTARMAAVAAGGIEKAIRIRQQDEGGQP